jgi:hypothetical protein
LKDETLIVWTGKIMSAEQALFIMDTDDKHYILQIADGFYQIPLSSHREPADWTNHSKCCLLYCCTTLTTALPIEKNTNIIFFFKHFCLHYLGCQPTAGFGKNSPILLSAMRDMSIGDEVLFDYGMCETDPRLWEPMECQCGAPTCRALITANDWQRPELWDRYEGYWSPHVQKLVNEIRSKTREQGRQQQQQQQNKQSKKKASDSYVLKPGKMQKRKRQQNKLNNKAMNGSGNTMNGVNGMQNGIVSPSTISASSSSDSENDTHQIPLSDWLPRASNWFDQLLLWLGIVRVKRLAEIYGNQSMSMRQKYTTG